MTKKRLLLPFTYGVDGKAIDHVLVFAKASDSTLVALALIPVLEARRSGEVRLERIQQAKDFLEMIHAKAVYYEVSLERQELFTNDIVEEIMASIPKMNCQGIILLFDGQEAKFLQASEAKQVQQSTRYPLYILHMLMKKRTAAWRQFFRQPAPPADSVHQ